MAIGRRIWWAIYSEFSNLLRNWVVCRKFHLKLRLSRRIHDKIRRRLGDIALREAKMIHHSTDLDAFDRKILDIVAIEGRISVTELSRRIGLSKSPTQARLKRLEETGLIRGYRALFDPIRLGRDHVAFVEVKLTDTRESALAEFNAAVIRVPEIEQCHLIAGQFDYLLKVRTASMSAYRLVLAEKISTLPYLANTSTYVAMQAVKEEGVGPVAAGG
jgi:Lrp/AsnC family leucine-responsive transcriptional regulator